MSCKQITAQVLFVPHMRVHKFGCDTTVPFMSRNNQLLEAFAAELKARRSAQKWSQEELAFRAQINRTYIAKLELAQNQPTLSVLLQLAVALNNELPDLVQAVMLRYKRSEIHMSTSELET